MKFKTLFLSMLAAAAIVSCNNESVLSGDELNGGAGEETYATFVLRAGVGSAATYAGDNEVEGTGGENAVKNAVLAIYNEATGDHEALAYVNAVPQGASSGNAGKVTLKCTTGNKRIYLAVNIYAPATLPTSITPGASSSILVYGRTDKQVENTATGSETYEGAAGTVFADTLNALLVSLADATYTNDFGNTSLATSGSPALPTTQVKADGLIRALTGGGNPTTTQSNNIVGNLSGNGTAAASAYLMSNWAGNNDVAGSYTNTATYLFKLKQVTATASRGGTGVLPPTGGGPAESAENAFIINVQRAVAKIGLNIENTVLTTNVGTGTNAGTVELETSARFAVGNISKATYPFQQFDGSKVKSAAYDCTEGIATPAPQRPLNQFGRFMDNSRVYGAYNLSTYPTAISANPVNTVISNIQSDPNTIIDVTAGASIAEASYVIVPENNNSQGFNSYVTYVVFPATYKPTDIIIGAPIGAGDAQCPRLTPAGTQPTWATGVGDTLYYVKDPSVTLLAQGKFFWGATTLADYIKNVLNVSDVQAQIAAWNEVSENEQAKLQKYYHGKCFYRVLVTDQNEPENNAAGRWLVRRNHVYDININKFNGPGIADPLSIIDPDPSTGPEPWGTVDAYVTATITVLKWHKVTQDTPVDL